jgi:hypothetical protein
VFADCTDRGTTAAVGGLPTLANHVANGQDAPIAVIPTVQNLGMTPSAVYPLLWIKSLILANPPISRLLMHIHERAPAVQLEEIKRMPFHMGE